MNSLIPKDRTTRLPGWIAPIIGAAMVAALGTAVHALVQQRGTEVTVAAVKADVQKLEVSVTSIKDLAHEQAKVQIRTDGYVAAINVKLENIAKTMDRLEKQRQ